MSISLKVSLVVTGLLSTAIGSIGIHQVQSVSKAEKISSKKKGRKNNAEGGHERGQARRDGRAKKE